MTGENVGHRNDVGLGWFGIFRLGAVQAAIGAIVMLATSLLNRVMVVEFGAAAAIPAALVAWHYGVQLTRPFWGHRSDGSERRSSWIMGGMALLALGTLIAVDATIMMAVPTLFGFALAILGFTLIGVGVGMAGTTLLALLASRVSAERKPAAAAISWTMMIAGIIIAAGSSAHWLDPFSEERLATVTSAVILCAFCVALVALRGVETNSRPVATREADASPQPFKTTLHAVWADDEARRFTGFVFVSMLAYSMQDLILEPFAGLVFGMTPGQSTALTATQHSGVLLGMLVAGGGGSLLARRFGAAPKRWIVLGCVGSALMLAALSVAALSHAHWPLKANIFGLGFMNGVFAVSAVGAMLGLASEANGGGEGARMGVWGAAQAIAFGLGGLLGAVIVDQLRRQTGQDGIAFEAAFTIEAILFVIAALVATGTRLTRTNETISSTSGKVIGA